VPRLNGESIYRRVSLRMHADERVRKLSRPDPCGLALWHELIFGEQTGIIPGLYRIGEQAFAEQLGWSLKGFRSSWAEVEGAGLAVKADWGARLVWVQNAIRHDRPRNPNQILHWRDAWEQLPECNLKRDAEQFLEQFLQQLGEQFAEAFRKIRLNSRVNQEAGSSKQEDLQPVVVARGGVRGGEPTACESVNESGPKPQDLSESQRLQISQLMDEGRLAEATALAKRWETGAT
jgi:hypothetical protein